MSRLLFAAVSLALSAGVSAQALTTTQTKNFSPVNNTRSTSSTGQFDSSPTQTLVFDKFTQATGVLTGVSASVSVTGGSLTLSATGTQSGTGTPQYSASSNLWAPLVHSGWPRQHLGKEFHRWPEPERVTFHFL